DLAATDGLNGNVSVLLGDGTGNFAAAITSSVGANPESFVVADFNRDGIPDLATQRNFFGNASFSVVLGTGSGSFGAPVYFPFSDPLSKITKGDFNRDGKTDVALINSDTGNASVFFGNGDGTFGSAMNFGVGNDPSSITAADLNLDGRLDLITSNFL